MFCALALQTPRYSEARPARPALELLPNHPEPRRHRLHAPVAVTLELGAVLLEVLEQAADRPHHHVDGRSDGDLELGLALRILDDSPVIDRAKPFKMQPIRRVAAQQFSPPRRPWLSAHVSSVPDRRPRGRSRYGLHRLRAQQRCARTSLQGTSPACLRPIASSAPFDGAYLIRVIESKRTFFSYEGIDR